VNPPFTAKRLIALLEVLAGCLQENNRLQQEQIRLLSRLAAATPGPGPRPAKSRTTPKRCRRQRPLTEKEQVAWASYMRVQNYTEVARQLEISRQAATKLIKSAINKTGHQTTRSVGSHKRLPTDARGNVAVADQD